MAKYLGGKHLPVVETTSTGNAHVLFDGVYQNIMDEYEMLDEEPTVEEQNETREYLRKCLNHRVVHKWLHTRSIYNLQRLDKPSASNLRMFINKLNKHLNGLKSFDCDVMIWRNDFIKLIYSKFDPLTKTKWDEIYRDVDTKKMNVSMLMNFLENTCQLYEKENLEPEKKEDTEA